MKDLHNPSIPSTSGQSSGHESSNAGDYEKLLKVMEEKVRVEKELDALGSVLQSVRFLRLFLFFLLFAFLRHMQRS